MPRYDYRCTSCGKTFEVSHGMREHPEIVCPDCGAPATRQLAMSGIVLKGSGFYNTDQRGKSGGTAGTGTAHDPEAGKTEAPAESASETPKKTETAKPAASADAPAKSDKGAKSDK